MRKNLKDKLGQRKRFRATVTRFGKKVNYNGYTDYTILLTNIIEVDTNTLVTDHQWFAFAKGFEKAQPKENDTVEFEARVKVYKKGYANRTLHINNKHLDYKLSNPTRIQLI